MTIPVSDSLVVFGITDDLAYKKSIPALQAMIRRGNLDIPVIGMARAGGKFTPTPALSHAILVYNRGRTSGLADGIVITPSHNPPESGGYKYNPSDHVLRTRHIRRRKVVRCRSAEAGV